MPHATEPETSHPWKTSTKSQTLQKPQGRSRSRAIIRKILANPFVLEHAFSKQQFSAQWSTTCQTLRDMARDVSAGTYEEENRAMDAFVQLVENRMPWQAFRQFFRFTKIETGLALATFDSLILPGLRALVYDIRWTGLVTIYKSEPTPFWSEKPSWEVMQFERARCLATHCPFAVPPWTVIEIKNFMGRDERGVKRGYAIDVAKEIWERPIGEHTLPDRKSSEKGRRVDLKIPGLSPFCDVRSVPL